MPSDSPVDVSLEVVALFERGGGEKYFGEDVTQLAHALQAAAAAQAAGADDEFTLAALLHDIGHLLEEDADPAAGVIAHDDVAKKWLRQRGFGSRLIELVGGHVAAKRYLVAATPDYFGRLSETSIRTLELQGGPMSPGECEAFERHPLFREMLRLRSWDEMAKVPEASVAPLDSYRPMLQAYLERQSHS